MFIDVNFLKFSDFFKIKTLWLVLYFSYKNLCLKFISDYKISNNSYIGCDKNISMVVLLYFYSNYS